MSNAFSELVYRAEQEKWCVKPFCTTCGSVQFREELNRIGGIGGGKIAEALSELTPHEITQLPNWQDAIRLAFYSAISFVENRGIVLQSWLARLDGQIRFADVVLFYIVRALPASDQIRQAWIVRCVSFATTTRDESLTESLLWTLRQEATRYPDLMTIANELSSSPRIKRAFSQVIVNQQ